MGREDSVAGKIKQAKGKANDVVGAAKGDTGQQIKGKAQKAVGKAQSAMGKASARANYLFALFRARDQRSLDGVLQAADAFSRLGDASVVRQALVVARDLAGRDAVAHARVDIAVTELGVRVASANGDAR